jgi:transcriptional regulator with XRE-family HTH domain
MENKRRRKKGDPAARLAMVLLRHNRGWLEKAQLAAALGAAASQISMWERGDRPIPREALERTADAAHFPRPLLVPLLRVIRAFRRAAQARSLPDRALTVTIALDLLPHLLATTDLLLAPTRQGADPEETEALWTRLQRRTPAERRLMVEEGEEYQTRALYERVKAESVALEMVDPAQARELGELTEWMGEVE